MCCKGHILKCSCESTDDSECDQRMLKTLLKHLNGDIDRVNENGGLTFITIYEN